MIRQFRISDTEQVMQLWLTGNEDAHSFVPKEYWRSNFEEVKKQLLLAEVFVYDIDGKIQGFIGMMDGYIAGIFVKQDCRSCGIGRRLVDFAKQTHSTLSLGVYKKNTRAVDFYLREGFVIVSEQVDEDTGEYDFTLSWKSDVSEISCQSEKAD